MLCCFILDWKWIYVCASSMLCSRIHYGSFLLIKNKQSIAPILPDSMQLWFSHSHLLENVTRSAETSQIDCIWIRRDSGGEAVGSPQAPFYRFPTNTRSLILFFFPFSPKNQETLLYSRFHNWILMLQIQKNSMGSLAVISTNGACKKLFLFFETVKQKLKAMGTNGWEKKQDHVNRDKLLGQEYNLSREKNKDRDLMT